MSERVRIEGREIFIPRVQGPKDVFGSPIFFLLKPSWKLDNDVFACPLCNVTFTQLLKRKHHCRNCGHIFCSKCCYRKVVLPHYGSDELQRICEWCKDMVELVSKSRSTLVSQREEAAKGIVAMMTTIEGQVKMLELGGLQTLIAVTSQGNDGIKKAVAAGIHTVAQHLSLHELLVDLGSIKAVVHILSTMISRDESAIMNALHTLKLFSCNQRIAQRILEEINIGVLLEPFITQPGTVALLAAGIVCILAEDQDNHVYLMKDNQNILSRLVKALSFSDGQMKETCLKALVHFTSGLNCRKEILLEDIACDRPLLRFLSANDRNEGLERAVCIVANLAADHEMQNKLQPYISGLAVLLECRGQDLDAVTLGNISRGLANFAEYSVNALFLINRLPLILSTLMLSNVEIHRVHAARLVVSLLTFEPAATLEKLTENGAESFLETILQLPKMNEMLISLLLEKGSRFSVTA